MNPWLVAGAAAALATKRGREVVRKGAVYGLAAALTAGDALFAAARGVTHTAGEAATATGSRISATAEGVKHGAEHLAGGLVSEARTVRGKKAEAESSKETEPPKETEPSAAAEGGPETGAPQA